MNKLILVTLFLLSLINIVVANADERHRLINFDNTLIAKCSTSLSAIHPVQVYFHRGTRRYFPENTIQAYKYAIRMGANWLDADIQLTKDNRIIILHDFTLPSYYLKNAQGHYVQKGLYVKDFTLRQLKTYYMGKPKPNTQYARLFPHQLVKGKIRIPALAEAVKQIANYAHRAVMWQLEVKTDPTNPKFSAYKAFTIQLVHFIEKHKLVKLVEVQAFDWRVLKLIHTLNPAIHTAALITNFDMKHTPPQLAGVWTAGLKPVDYHYDAIRMAKVIGAYNLEPYEPYVTKQMVQEAHQLHMKVVPWHWAEKQGSKFDYTLTKKLILAGVDGLIVDGGAETQAVVAQYHRQSFKYPYFICKQRYA